MHAQVLERNGSFFLSGTTPKVLPPLREEPRRSKRLPQSDPGPIMRFDESFVATIQQMVTRGCLSVEAAGEFITIVQSTECRSFMDPILLRAADVLLPVVRRRFRRMTATLS